MTQLSSSIHYLSYLPAAVNALLLLSSSTSMISLTLTSDIWEPNLCIVEKIVVNLVPLSWLKVISEKKVVRIIGFMVFKSTGLDSRFQCKNQFGKICTESRDISQNVSNFGGLVWKADFWHFFGNILGLGANFSKLIFYLIFLILIFFYHYK